jgi:hypothetical protein
MKYFLLLLVFCCSTGFFCHAQHEFIETKRFKDKKEIPFTDTIYIKINHEDTFDVRMNGFVYKAAIYKNILGLPYGNYNILKYNVRTIILEKSGTEHHFSPKIKEHNPLIDDYEKHKNTNKLPAEVISKVDIYQLEGKWEAYKRANRNGPSEITNFKSIVKTVSITIKDEQVNGVMKAGATTDYLFEVRGIENGYLVTYTPNNQKVLMPILGQTDREWIFEDNKGIVYYMYRK